MPQRTCLTNQVQMLTRRLHMWDFLCKDVPTYKGLILKFLAPFEYDRHTDTVPFIMRDRHYTLYTSQLMSLLGFPIKHASEMDDPCTFHSDMDIDRFKQAICGTWTTQKASQIKHPALRYIQRVLAHTLFDRGETQAIMYRPKLFYLYCMLRRNEGEMYFIPHIGENLAKHFEHVANSTKLNGTISYGGVITKLATALRLDLTHEDEAPGSIYMDLVALLNMRLIIRTTDQEGYLSKGPGKHGYNLPLTVDTINPHTPTT